VAAAQRAADLRFLRSCLANDRDIRAESWVEPVIVNESRHGQSAPVHPPVRAWFAIPTRTQHRGTRTRLDPAHRGRSAEYEYEELIARTCQSVACVR
jgi:hypothetical protein